MEDALARKIAMLSQRYEVIYKKNTQLLKMRVIKGGLYDAHNPHCSFCLKHNKDLSEKYNPLKKKYMNKKKLLILFLTLILSVPVFSQKNNTEVLQQKSLTAKFLNRSANARIVSFSFLVAGGIYAGATSSIKNGNKDKVMTAGCCVFGAGALISSIVDMVYFKKAAKAAKIEIRPAKENIGLSFNF